MKRILGYGSLILFFGPLNAAVVPYIQIRSQSVDSARELSGWTQLINKYDPNRTYGAIAFTLEYMQSFNPQSINNVLFGDLLQCNSQCQFLGISGSQYGNRDARDLLADYFGLPVDFKSQVSFSPSIRNLLLDLNFYLGLDDWLCGLYFRIHMPIVHTWWNLGFNEKIINKGSIGYAPGYFSDSTSTIGTGDLLQSFEQYVSDQLVPNLGSDVLFESLKFARMAPKHLSLTRPADLEAVIGWNFLQSDEYHFGFNLRFTAPTGNRPKGYYLFEPIIGNGHHWGIGIGLTSHWRLWVNRQGNEHLGLYIDANVGTLFKTHQVRTFDLINGPLSRYMLAELLGSPAENLYANTSPATTADSNAPIGQFQGIFRPVANLTSIDVYSSFPAQADVTLLLNYTYNHLTFDIGYNYWGLTCEKLKTTCCTNPLNDSSNWALKGDAYVYGFVATDASTLPNAVIALSATESLATVNAGTNTPIGTLFSASQMRNPNIDNPQFAVVDTTDPLGLIMVSPGLAASGDEQQRTSYQPTYLTSASLNMDGAQVGGASQKVFAHISHTWDRCECWIPYVGIGGMVEFAQGNENANCCATSCVGCLNTNVSQWGVWAKGGFAF